MVRVSAEIQKETSVRVVFPKIGHFWLDSGLVGLKKILDSVDKDITVFHRGEEIVLEGAAASVQEALEKAYNYLVGHYYDISTKKQLDDIGAYNFYYDSKQNRFFSFAKKKSCGIAEIIYNKAPRPTGSYIKWASKSDKKVEIEYQGKKMKRTVVRLPDSHAHLQENMDEFLNKNGLDVTTSGLLVDGPYAVRPKVKIKADSEVKKTSGHCYLCGQPSDVLEEASQTTFPLITGTSGVLSFNSMAQNPEKVCWKCSFIGKFVPANGFYYTNGDNIFTFFPYASSLEKMLNVYAPLHEAETKDPNYFYNFDHGIGGYFHHSFEITFAFLYTLYQKVVKKERGNEEPVVLDWDRFYALIIDKAVLEFFVMHARKEGNTFSVKTLWPFRETDYFYRLLHRLEQGGVDVKEFLRLLVDFNQKNENTTLVRNRICERILKKRTILDLVESFVYRAEKNYIKPIVDFLLIYEEEIRKGDSMTKEEQDTAVALGRRVGTAVARSEGGKKGDLFALRKVRKKVDFLEQINRLQFKLGSEFVVPADLYEGRLTDQNFDEFKQFCMIAALNSYNAAMNESKKQGGN
ncbi:MAG TPA: hypothetical protein DCZ10_18695 [Pelotomaculum sp.]|nr:hypothetical protein [Pelotomaculum sp.]